MNNVFILKGLKSELSTKKSTDFNHLLVGNYENIIKINLVYINTSK